MKKTLFHQELSAVLISIVITALLAFSAWGILGAYLNIPIKNAVLTSDTVVLNNDKIQFSTRELSSAESQNLIIGVKSGKVDYESGGIPYKTNITRFEGGLTVLTLTPNFGTDKIYGIILAALVIVFLACYILVLRWIEKRREEEIFSPFERLSDRVKQLADGDFDVHIPDSGAEEIRQLSENIESLRLRLKDEIYMNKKTSEDRKFLISGISHDLRTPLTALRGYIEGILDGAAEGEKQRSYLEKSLEKVQIINRMIGDFLTYSKLDMNQVEFKLQMLNIGEYLLQLVSENQMVFERERKKITLECQINREYNVCVDLEQLDRVMGNVFENALRYTTEEIGEVTVYLRETSGSVVVEIHDNGVGMAEEDVPKIFDRFYRGEKARKIKGSSGLGLAISKRIVENMGGRIWASSKLGEGTSIMISLKKYEVQYEKNTDN